MQLNSNPKISFWVDFSLFPPLSLQSTRTSHFDFQIDSRILKVANSISQYKKPRTSKISYLIWFDMTTVSYCSEIQLNFGKIMNTWVSQTEFLIYVMILKTICNSFEFLQPTLIAWPSATSVNAWFLKDENEILKKIWLEEALWLS